MGTPIIRYENFGFRYAEGNDWALRNVTLDVEPGEIMLVLGRSGCGKSTLSLALNGAVPHLFEGEAEGSLTVAGKSVLNHSVSQMTNHVGMVFQDPEIQLFALTVEDEVAMSLEAYNIPREEMRERVEWAMSVCGLRGLELNSPAKLSGGQKQRVAIAAVIAREPEVLVFDEPTGNLDPVGSRSVYETVRRICDESGRTIVLVEHDLGPVIDLVNRVVVLEEGRVLFQGTPREVLREYELLRQCGVKIPVATEFALRLEQKQFISYPQIPITVDEALQPLATRLNNHTASRPVNHQANHHSPVQTSLASKPPVARTERPIIEFQNVVHQYDTGHKGIDDINLQIYPGEFVAICGMNGAGKTTLSLHTVGLLKPTSGRVLVDGQDTKTRTVAEMARTVGLIFQNPNHQLFKDSVEAEIAFGPKNIGWDSERIQEASKRVMELVELQGLEKWDPESLSIGQKQRVAIASVLVMEPRILLLDEPTTGQDQRTLKPFMDLVARLNKEGMTVLMITHDMDVALEYSSRMVVMSRSKIIADGTPAEIFLRPDILEEAKLHPPGILNLAKQLNHDQSLYLPTFEAVEQWLGLNKGEKVLS